MIVIVVNRLLVRLHQLYVINEEMIGREAVCALLTGAPHSQITLHTPLVTLLRLAGDAPNTPAWWDWCADKCLLLGVARHGFERYLVIRDDPLLCFYERCGPCALPDPSDPAHPATPALLRVDDTDSKLLGILQIETLFFGSTIRLALIFCPLSSHFGYKFIGHLPTKHTPRVHFGQKIFYIII